MKIEEKEVKTLKRKINTKLSDYRRRDKGLSTKLPQKNKYKTTITLEDAVNMILILKSNRCPECNTCMYFTNYKPYERQQFSFDRIDETMIHDKHNLRIICYSCNSARRKNRLDRLISL